MFFPDVIKKKLLNFIWWNEHLLIMSVCLSVMLTFSFSSSNSYVKEFCHPCLKLMEWKVMSPNPKNCSNGGHLIKINFFDICSTVSEFMMTRIVEDGSWMFPREKWTLDSTAPSGTGTGTNQIFFLFPRSFLLKFYFHKILQFNIIEFAQILG